MMITTALLLVHAALAQPRPIETYRFELVMNQSSCTRADGEGYVCGEEVTPELIEVQLEPVAPNALETVAYEGTSAPVGLSINATTQYRPSVTVRKSMLGADAIYTVRFKTQRADGPSFETVYIEDGNELGLARPLTLMADRFGNGARYFRQLSFVLNRI